jgi:hypothetical protein
MTTILEMYLSTLVFLQYFESVFLIRYYVERLKGKFTFFSLTKQWLLQKI